MIKVTYVNTDGTETVMDVAEGTSLMQAAVSSGLDGVIGECGGSAMCATCHVYVNGTFLEKLSTIYYRRYGRGDAGMYFRGPASNKSSRLSN